MDLQKQTKNVNVVIRKNASIKKDKMITFLSEYCSQYAFIEHLNDLSPSTGKIEGIHYHIVMLLPKRKRLYTILNDVTDYFGFNNNHGIEIEVLKSLEGSIQYLTHKNDKDKTQHDFNDIISNIDKEELMTIYDTESNSLTFDRIMFIIKNSSDLLDIIQAIGFTRYNMYRNTIKDMVDCYRSRVCSSLEKSDNGIKETIVQSHKNHIPKDLNDDEIPF